MSQNTDTKYEIALKTDPSTLGKLCQTDREFDSICHDENFWKEKTLLDFNKSTLTGISWKQYYQQLYTGTPITVTSNVSQAFDDLMTGHPGYNPHGYFIRLKPSRTVNSIVTIGMGTNCGIYWTVSLDYPLTLQPSYWDRNKMEKRSKTLGETGGEDEEIDYDLILTWIKELFKQGAVYLLKYDANNNYQYTEAIKDRLVNNVDSLERFNTIQT